MNTPGILPKGFVGHLVDLYRIGSFNFNNPHSYSKFRNINAVRRRSGAKVLVETGTFRGVTTKRCAPHFEKIFTIELDPTLAAESRRYLSVFDHVKVIEGDANEEVTKLLHERQIESPAVFFLDGHFSGGQTAHGDLAEPALVVLEELAKHLDCVAGIIIDDFREFGVAPGWPEKWKLIRLCEEKFASEGFKLSVHLDQVIVERQS
ncbi:MAG: hypothetical protein IPJ88_12930 [Myxococcales bacterium]|nr:MAG: hypothetical protein IPJ88_12930 [Myxococcales bacterium]